MTNTTAMTDTTGICFPPTLFEQIFGRVEAPEASRAHAQVEVPETTPALVTMPEPTPQASVESEKPDWHAAFEAIRQEQRLSA